VTAGVGCTQTVTNSPFTTAQDASGDPTFGPDSPTPGSTISGQKPVGGWVRSDYSSGGCYNLTSTAMTVTCNPGNWTQNIAEDQAGYSSQPTGTQFSFPAGPTSCSFQQKEGWTGFNSPICRRNLSVSVSWQAPPSGCQ